MLNQDGCQKEVEWKQEPHRKMTKQHVTEIIPDGSKNGAILGPKIPAKPFLIASWKPTCEVLGPWCAQDAHKTPPKLPKIRRKWSQHASKMLSKIKNTNHSLKWKPNQSKMKQN